MGWKLFRVLRWATDSTKPALNKSGAMLFCSDSKRLWTNTGTGYVASDTPPIGSTYMQFPGKDDPATLWPLTTWSNISSETLLKGRVPRVEGTASSGGQNAAAAFGSSQDDQGQGHKHSPYSNSDANTAPSSGGYLRGYLYNSGEAPAPTTSGPVSDGSNGTPRTGAATRDASVTVRIWQRTA